MIISKQELTNLLDSADIENQGVYASEALGIDFGPKGKRSKSCIDYKALDGSTLVVDFNEKGEVLFIELISSSPPDFVATKD